MSNNRLSKDKIAFGTIFILLMIFSGFGSFYITNYYATNADFHYFFENRYKPPLYLVQFFVKVDKTNENKYVVGSFDCTQFSETVIENAKHHLWEVGFVSVVIDNASNHAVVCFNTKEGLYFLEPQNDMLYNKNAFEKEYSFNYTIVWK